MRLPDLNLPVETSTSGRKFTINISDEQIAHFTHLLVTANYKDPLTSSIREVLSNAFDASLEANPDRPARVEVTQTPDRIIIRDYGVGLSPERIESIYTVIGASTKRSSDTQIGAYGIGRLAPLALNKHFIVESFLDGVVTTGCVAIGPKGAPIFAIWDEQPTDQPNGLAVHIMLPSAWTNGEVSRRQVTDTILGLTEGSRHDVKLWFQDKRGDVRPLLSQLNPDHILSPENKYLEVEGEGFTAEFYPVCRMAGCEGEYAQPSRAFMTDWGVYELLLDMGGVLYSIGNNSGFINQLTSSVSFCVQQPTFCMSNTRTGCKAPYDLSSTKFEQEGKEAEWLNKGNLVQQLEVFSHYHVKASGTIILRVPAGFMPLTQTREEFIDCESSKETLARVFLAADQALRAKSQQLLQAKIDGYVEKFGGLEVAKNLLGRHYDYVCFSVFYGGEELKIPLDDRTCYLHQLIKPFVHTYVWSELERLDNALVVTKRHHLWHEVKDTSYVRNKCQISFHIFNPFLLQTTGPTPLHNYLQSKCGKVGQRVSRLKQDKLITLQELMLFDFQVMLSDSTVISARKLVKQFGEEVIKKPILLINIDYGSDRDKKVFLKTLEGQRPLVNFLGVYDHDYTDEEELRLAAKREEAKERSPQKSNDAAETSLLLRQVKATTQESTDTCLLSKESSLCWQDTVKIKGELTAEDLLGKVYIYKDQSFTCVAKYNDLQDKSGLSIRYLPKQFLEGIEPIIWTVTNSACERLNYLQSRVDVKWLHFYSFQKLIKQRLIYHYGHRIELFKDLHYYSLVYNICKADYGHLLPGPTRELGELDYKSARAINQLYFNEWLCNDSLEAAKRLTSNDGVYEDPEVINARFEELYAPYKGVNTDCIYSLFGPYLRPVVNSLIQAEKNVTGGAYSAPTKSEVVKHYTVVRPVVELVDHHFLHTGGTLYK